MSRFFRWMLAIAAMIVVGQGATRAQVDDSVQRARAELAARQADVARLPAERAAADEAVANAEHGTQKGLVKLQMTKPRLRKKGADGKGAEVSIPANEA